MYLKRIVPAIALAIALAVPSVADDFYSPRFNGYINYSRFMPDLTDAYGYGSTPLTWKERENQPNGVPDYVDEAGWAFDSAWAALFEQAAFTTPLLSTDQWESSYIVVVMELSENVLGHTKPANKVAFGRAGYRSYMQITSDLSSTPLKGQVARAMRVICAHEIFHGSQYASVHFAEGKQFDDFTLGWIEGTATYMPHYVFPDANNIDLLKSLLNRYFENPTEPIFAHVNDGKTEYTGFLGAYFIAEGLNHDYGIDLIKDIFDLNKEKRRPLHTLANLASEKWGETWVSILGDFYAESYFSGNRADGRYFVPEAHKFDAWTYRTVAFETMAPATMEIKPWGMNRQGFTKPAGVSGEMPFSVQAANGSLERNGNWAISIIVNYSATSRNDTLLTDFGPNGGVFEIPDDEAELVVVITNGSDSLRSAQITFGQHPVVARLDDRTTQPFSVYRNDAATASLYSITGRRMRGTNMAFQTAILNSHRNVVTHLGLSGIVKAERCPE